MADPTDDDPFKDKRESGPWLELLREAERADSKYQQKADGVDKLYADFDTLAKDSTDRQFQMFWANMEVLKPSVYARMPVPVVVPRFKDQKELPRRASEILERCLTTSFDLDDFDETMKLVRDDLVINARGVVWLRLEETDSGDGTKTQRVCKEHLDRRDFRHGPARKWKEVPWVARRGWLSREEGLKRFGDIWLKVKLTEKRDEREDEFKGDKKGEVWELWHKVQRLSVWISPGVDDVLDITPPPLDLEGFWPCPRPAYATLKRGTLTPVPDLLYYRDQLEEINDLTARIAALTESLRLKGFYPAGASDVAEAVETILKEMDDRATLVPVSNLAMFGNQNGSLKDSIVWLPIDMVAVVIKECISLRSQLIQDVYQITGISDIMRGSTVASETLGAQQLKAGYGSIRIKDKQNELVRIALDVAQIEGEIIGEHFSAETLIDMAQIDDLPTDQQIAQQIAQVTMSVKQAAADPVMVERARANPQQAQQILQAAQQQVQQLQGVVTIDKVIALLRSQRMRPFVLDIETDSTIQPDENAAKQRATEFVTAVGGFLQQAVTAVQMVPEAAPVAAEMLKFVASQFRAGRSMEGVIDKFADQIAQQSQAQKPPSPEQVKAEAEQKARNDQHQFDMARQQAEAEHNDRIAAADERMKAMDVEIKKADLAKAGMEMQAGPNGEHVVIDKADRAHAEAMDAIGKLAQLITAQGQTLTSGMEQLAQLIAAPNELVRDQAGRPVGSRKVLPARPAVN